MEVLSLGEQEEKGVAGTVDKKATTVAKGMTMQPGLWPLLPLIPIIKKSYEQFQRDKPLPAAAYGGGSSIVLNVNTEIAVPEGGSGLQLQFMEDQMNEIISKAAEKAAEENLVPATEKRRRGL